MRSGILPHRNANPAWSLRALALVLLVLSVGATASGPVAGPSSGKALSGGVFTGRAGDAPSAPLAGPMVTGVEFKIQVQNGVVLMCKLTLKGTNFQQGCVVNINGQRAPKILYHESTEVLAKGGAKLAKMLPKHTSVNLTVVNPDGQTSNPYPFTRP